MSSNTTIHPESADAAKVDAAAELLRAGELDNAERLLMSVIANTPAQYSNVEEDDEGISIKFWDQDSFIHFVTWQEEHSPLGKNINWIGNAYPRAFFYLGFISVKRKEFTMAIGFLDKGQSLEPTNPMFVYEKAQAMVHSGRPSEALALYDQITEINAHVSAHDLAVARRGRGFVLIEKGDLVGAEHAFRSSLEIDPDNDVALHELAYIEHLRQGGSPSHMEAVATTPPRFSECAVCGEQFEEGVVIPIEGRLVSLCRRCDRKLTKKWWQFWK